MNSRRALSVCARMALLALALAALPACPPPAQPAKLNLLISWGESGLILPNPAFPGFLREVTAIRAEKRRDPPAATIAAGNYLPADSAMPKQFARIFSMAGPEFNVCGLGPYELNNGPPIVSLLPKSCVLSTQADLPDVPPVKFLPFSSENTLAVVTYIPNPKPQVSEFQLTSSRFESALLAAQQKRAIILVLAYDILQSQARDFAAKHPEVDILFGQIRPDPKPGVKGNWGPVTSGSVEAAGTSWIVDAGQVGLYRLQAEARGQILDSLKATTIPVLQTDGEPAEFETAKQDYLRDRKAMSLDEPLRFGEYSTAKSCERCHDQQYRRWLSSPHAGAMVALSRTRDEYTVPCLPCHTAGFGEPGGFRNYTATATLGAVQCESCHGPSLKHMQEATRTYPKPPAIRPPNPSKKTCERCHTADLNARHSGTSFPAFDYASAVKTIHH